MSVSRDLSGPPSRRALQSGCKSRCPEGRGCESLCPEGLLSSCVDTSSMSQGASGGHRLEGLEGLPSRGASVHRVSMGNLSRE
jgi:hypothetical protein